MCIYPIITSFANCNNNFLTPSEANLISAFWFAPKPSKAITSPLPNFACSTMVPTIILSSNKFADEAIRKAFEQLKEGKGEERRLYDWLVRAFNDVEQNAFCGIQIPKRLIPKEYLQKYDVKNVWKYNLPNAWRLIYSIEHQEIIVVSIVLEWMDHKEYEHRFNY